MTSWWRWGGRRSAGPTMMHRTGPRIDNDLHNPAMLARLGAMQGAVDAAGAVRRWDHGVRVHPPERRRPGARLGHRADGEGRDEDRARGLLAALADKNPAMRAAAAAALADYHDSATSMAIYPLLADKKKYPVRLIAAAAYLRTTGNPGAVHSAGCARGAGRTVERVPRFFLCVLHSSFLDASASVAGGHPGFSGTGCEAPGGVLFLCVKSHKVFKKGMLSLD